MVLYHEFESFEIFYSQSMSRHTNFFVLEAKKKREKKLDYRYFIDKSSREIVFFLPLKNSK